MSSTDPKINLSFLKRKAQSRRQFLDKTLAASTQSNTASTTNASASSSNRYLKSILTNDEKQSYLFQAKFKHISRKHKFKFRTPPLVATDQMMSTLNNDLISSSTSSPSSSTAAAMSTFNSLEFDSKSYFTPLGDNQNDLAELFKKEENKDDKDVSV